MNDTAMMHGMDWAGEDLAGYVLAEKYDGCRAYWDGRRLWSRGGMSPALPASWLAALPAETPLDCELYDGIGGVYRCGVALRHGRFAPTMRLMVFDAPTATGGYASRMRAAQDAIAGSAIAIAAPITVCHDTDHALAFMRDIQARGGEGAVARQPDAGYVIGRHRSVLKIKTEV